MIKSKTKKAKKQKNGKIAKKNHPMVKTWQTGVMCTFSFRANKSKWWKPGKQALFCDKPLPPSVVTSCLLCLPSRSSWTSPLNHRQTTSSLSYHVGKAILNAPPRLLFTPLHCFICPISSPSINLSPFYFSVLCHHLGLRSTRFTPNYVASVSSHRQGHLVMSPRGTRSVP